MTLFGEPLDKKSIDSDLKALYSPVQGKVDRHLVEALSDIRNGKDPEVVLRKFSRLATNTLIHGPTKVIRDQDNPELIKKIIGIENEDKS
jgi:glutamyl-tRNA reductase